MDKKDGKFVHASGSSLHTVEEGKKHNKSVENNGGNNYNLQNLGNQKTGNRLKRIKSANIVRRHDTTGRVLAKKNQFLSTQNISENNTTFYQMPMKVLQF